MREWSIQYDEQKNFAGKVNKIAKMLVRRVALEGLQPMVTEAFSEGDNSDCEVDAVKKSNEESKFWVVMIIVFNIVGFATFSFVTYKIYKHFEFLRADFAHRVL